MVLDLLCEDIGLLAKIQFAPGAKHNLFVKCQREKRSFSIYDPDMEGLSNEMRRLGKDLAIVGEVGITGFNASKGVFRPASMQVCATCRRMLITLLRQIVYL